MAETTAPKLFGPDGVEIPLSGPPPLDLASPVDTYQNRLRNYPSRGLTPERLGQIHDEMDRGETWNAIQLCQEMRANHTKIGSVLALRRAALTGIDYVITPSDGDDSEANDIANEADEVFSQEMIKQYVGDMMEAIFPGFAVDWITWGVVDGSNVPVELTPIDQRRFLWNSFLTEKRVLQNVPLNVSVNDSALLRPLAQTTIKDELLIRPVAGSMGEPIQPFTTARAFYMERNEHPTRAGLWRPISWLYLGSNMILKDWMHFVELFGIPMRVATIRKGDYESPTIAAQVREDLRLMGVNASGIFPEGSQIQVITPNNLKAVASELIDYFDKCIGGAVLGHELASGPARGGGGQLGITAALQASDQTTKGDAYWIARNFRRDLLIPWVGFNKGWDKIRLAPNLSFAFERPFDKGQEATTVATLAKAFPKLKFSEANLREKFDQPPPIDEADAITGESAVALLPPGAVAPGKPGESANPTGGPGAPATPPEPDEPKPPAKPGTKAGLTAAADPGEPRPTPSQKNVDELAEQGIQKAQAAIVALAEPIRKIILRGAKLGTPSTEVAKQIAAAYKDLDTKALQRYVYQQMALARTYGRGARVK